MTQQESNKLELTCSWEGCQEEAKFPAPKSPENRAERCYFCLQHIRLYNYSWDFFRKMDAQQIADFQKENITGHRPTWKFGINNNYVDMEEIRSRVFSTFRGTHKPHHEKTQKNNRLNEIPELTRNALITLGIQYPASWDEVKIKYKKLVKQYHPDVNTHSNSDKIKRINQAYSHLKNSKLWS